MPNPISYARMTKARHKEHPAYTHTFVCLIAQRKTKKDEGELWHASVTWKEIGTKKKPRKLDADQVEEGNAFNWVHDQIAAIMECPIDQVVFEENWKPKN